MGYNLYPMYPMYKMFPSKRFTCSPRRVDQVFGCTMSRALRRVDGVHLPIYPRGGETTLTAPLSGVLPSTCPDVHPTPPRGSTGHTAASPCAQVAQVVGADNLRPVLTFLVAGT